MFGNAPGQGLRHHVGALSITSQFDDHMHASHVCVHGVAEVSSETHALQKMASEVLDSVDEWYDRLDLCSIFYYAGGKFHCRE